MRQGSQVGDYQILGKWAQMRSGVIYAARSLADSQDKRLFSIEALGYQDSYVSKELDALVRASSFFDDSGLPKNYCVFEEDSQLYLVSDFVRGETLDIVFRTARSQISRLCAVALVQRLGAMLESARAARKQAIVPFELIHGDISPENIMFSYKGGHVRLLNFGVALAMSRAGHGPEAVVGHPAYLAPERLAHGSNIDDRCDVYSLGIILWELLTQTRAIQGTTDDEMIAAALSARIPKPSSKGVRSGRDLDDLVLRAIARDPKARFESVRSFTAALNTYLRSRSMSFSLEAELTGLMDQHFQHKSRAMGTLVTRWLATPLAVRSSRRRSPTAGRPKASPAARPKPQAALFSDPALQAGMLQPAGNPHRSSSVRVETADLAQGMTDDLRMHETGDLTVSTSANGSVRRALSVVVLLFLLAFAGLVYFEMQRTDEPPPPAKPQSAPPSETPKG